jgi:deoxyribose-phosphate aldolase
MTMSIKTDLIEAIRSLPDSATVADIQYRLYVVNKVLKSEIALKKSGGIKHAAAAKKLRAWLIT